MKVIDKNQILRQLAVSVLASAVLTSITLPSSAQSNEDSTTTNSANSIEQVNVTAQRFEVDNSEFPGSLSVIGEQALSAIEHRHIQQSLSRVSGVSLQRGEGQEYLPAIRSPVLTGGGACGAFLIAQDGIPVRSSGFCNINELFDAHTEFADQIDVLKGPGSAFHGSNALHGVVNVITPDPLNSQDFVRLESGANDYSRIKLGVAAGTENNRLGIYTSATRDGGYRDSSGYDQQKVTVKHHFSGSDYTVDSGLTFTNLNQETAGFITGLNAFKRSSIAESNPNPEAFRDTQSLRVWSKIAFEIGEKNQFLVTPYYRKTDMDFLQHFLPGTPLEENEQDGVGLQTSWQHQFNRSVSLITGIDLEYAQGSLIQSQDLPTQGSAFLQETIPVGIHYDYDVDSSTIASFAHVSWDVSEQWNLTFGVRYEDTEYDYTNNSLTGRTRDDGTECGFGGCRYSRPPSSVDDFDNVSPKLTASYKINSDLLVYSRLSQGFRAPQATELYRLQRDQEVADLDSEEVNSFELGIKGTLNAVSFDVSAYYFEKDNFIFRDSDFFNVDDGETEHTGIEVESAYAFSEKWRISSAFSYSRHQYTHDQIINEINIRGNDIDTAPRGFSNTRLAYTPTASVGFELEWQYVSSYYLDPENLSKYEGHDLLHLRGHWEVNSDIQLSLRVENLTDRRYAERADFTTFTDERYFPGRPRSVYASVDFRW